MGRKKTQKKTAAAIMLLPLAASPGDNPLCSRDEMKCFAVRHLPFQQTYMQKYADDWNGEQPHIINGNVLVYMQGTEDVLLF